MNFIVLLAASAWPAQALRAEQVIAPRVNRIIVSLADQAFAAFDGDHVVLRGPVSTGRDNLTPLGSFRVTHKHEEWTSTIYHLPMPFFLRLNGGPVGLHKGYLPGQPDSHGCIRLTTSDAHKLFGFTAVGARVEIVPSSTRHTRGIPQPPLDAQAQRSYYKIVEGQKIYLNDEQAAAHESKLRQASAATPRNAREAERRRKEEARQRAKQKKEMERYYRDAARVLGSD